jgi:hypothetical protein
MVSLQANEANFAAAAVLEADGDHDLAAQVRARAHRILPADYVPAAIPADLSIPDEALYGKCKHFIDGSEIEPSARPAAMGAMLAMVSQQVRIDISSYLPPSHYRRCNLNVAVLGKSGNGKGFVWGRMCEAVYNTTHYTHPNITTINYSSGEAIISEYPRYIKVKGDDGKDEITETALTYVTNYIDEGKVLFGKAKAEGSSLLEYICSMFYMDSITSRRKGEKETSNVRMSSFLCLPIKSFEQFQEYFGEHISEGLMTRTIFCNLPIMLLPDDTWSRDHADLPEPLNLTKELYVSLTRENMEWSNWYKRWYAVNRPNIDTARISDIAVRVAVITAAINGESTVSWECWTAACAFVDWQITLKQELVPSEALTIGAKCAERIIATMRRMSKEIESNENGHYWLNKRNIFKRGHLSEVFGKSATQEWEHLIEVGYITSNAKEMEANPDLKPAYRLAKDMLIK